jgi:hypothetical protein
VNPLSKPPINIPINEKDILGHTWARWFSDLYDYLLGKVSVGAKGDTGAIGPQGLQGPTGATGAQGAPGSMGNHGVTLQTLPKASTDTNFDDSILSQHNNRIIFAAEPPLYADNDAATWAGLALGTVYRKGAQSWQAFLDVVTDDVTAAIYQAVITESGEYYPQYQNTITSTDIPNQLIIQESI